MGKRVLKISAMCCAILTMVQLLGGMSAYDGTKTSGLPVGEPPKPVPDDGVIRILAIGNSFSQDAVEQYLWNLADAEGFDVVIGNMYIGGCTLATHLTHAMNDAGAYVYRKIALDGTKTEKGSYKLSTAIAEEPWDFITLQQVSDYSGVYSTFAASLPTLAAYVEERATNGNMKLALHQTWAYAKNSTHGAFPTYNKDQTTMYNAIVDAYEKAAELTGIDIVIPSGTAIQNGRTSYLGDTFCRDGYHLEVNYSRYTSACTWFETLFDTDVTGNDFVPASVSAYDAEIARHAAHAAVLRPDTVTEMAEYKKGPGSGTLTPGAMYIDFGNGSNTAPAPWNNVTSISSTTPVALTDSDGEATGATVTITKQLTQKQ